MKYFTAPNGTFVLEIPTEWQYMNVAAGYEEKSPYSFELYENNVGAFQISCYSTDGQNLPKDRIIHKAEDSVYKSFETKMKDDEFEIHLWFSSVEDHFFMAKYIYDKKEINNPKIKEELKKVDKVLSTVRFLKDEQRDLAIEIDKYENFVASLAASFDLRYKAIEKDSFIEYVIVLANQIDAYLRLSIILHEQLEEQTTRIDTKYLYQADGDQPIMERKIYKIAYNKGIINQDQFEELESLYKKRNKVVHRYIISSFRTREFLGIAMGYEKACEKARLTLQTLEEKQYEENIGIHANRLANHDEYTDEEIQYLHSKVNDKHLRKDLYRPIQSNWNE